MEEINIKSTFSSNNRKRSYQNENTTKILGFVYTNIMKFPKNIFVNNGIFSNKFLENVRSKLFGREAIHHWHIPGKTVSYVHNFCNQKVRGNKNQRSINAHNLFGFDFSLFKRPKIRSLANHKSINWQGRSNKQILQI